jgi:hypothetical protein
MNGVWRRKVLSSFEQKRFHTYPHCNGFADGGTSLVLGQIEPEHISMWKVDLATGDEFLIRRFRQPTSYFDIAVDANVLAAVAEGAVWLFDLNCPGDSRILLQAPPGLTLQGLPSITADGTRVLVPFEGQGRYGAILVDVLTSQSRTVISHQWWANHFHFSPYDPEWIIYAHEGRCDQITDRVWAWHEQLAPQGRCVFDQTSSVAGKPLQVGHETACAHDASILVVAYGASLAGPRGLYEVFLDGRASRLVSEADRDWHGQMSHCGRWAVIDTTGPHDAPGCGWDQAGQVSDIMWVGSHTGQRAFLARTAFASHPWHPHPALSPDGRYLLYAEAAPDVKCPSGRLLLLECHDQIAGSFRSDPKLHPHVGVSIP